MMTTFFYFKRYCDPTDESLVGPVSIDQIQHSASDLTDLIWPCRKWLKFQAGTHDPADSYPPSYQRF